MRIHVVIPTTGRAEVTRQTVDRLSLQTRAPDCVLIVAVTPEDVAGLDTAAIKTDVAFARRGLCSQRNHALEELRGKTDLIVFFDDDFVASPTFLEEAERLFEAEPEIVGATGRIIADGVRSAGIAFEDAVRLIDDDSAQAQPDIPLRPLSALYGCNMALRMKACEGLRFDENLPLYGWQEDIDFSYRLGDHGKLVKSGRMAGVHMGVKTARTPGKRLGYSQIANPVYLLRKGAMPSKLAFRLMRQNLAANLVRSFMPEPHVDRRGRLAGNMLAVWDLMIGRIDPRKIVDMS